MVRKVAEATRRSLAATHGQSRAEERAADAKAESIHFSGVGDLLRHAERREHAKLEVVVPRVVTLLGLDIAPRDHEHGVSFGERMRDEGVLRRRSRM